MQAQRNYYPLCVPQGTCEHYTWRISARASGWEGCLRGLAKCKIWRDWPKPLSRVSHVTHAPLRRTGCPLPWFFHALRCGEDNHCFEIMASTLTSSPRLCEDPFFKSQLSLNHRICTSTDYTFANISLVNSSALHVTPQSSQITSISSASLSSFLTTISHYSFLLRRKKEAWGGNISHKFQNGRPQSFLSFWNLCVACLDV